MKTREDKRTELVNAEKLFDLPITSYPNLALVSKEMLALKQIYSLYSEQKQAREEWAQTLWVNLNTQHLQDGIEQFIKQLKKMPKEYRGSTIGKQLDAKMNEFKLSIPLFIDLKHEALRDRHWKTLMSKTGKEFDMNPEVLTLEALFAMNLNNYEDVISEIVTSAMKELSIERGIKEVAELWDNMKFIVQKYVKGTSDRGFVLGAIDEIIVSLDDNAMNLQSMSASRYVGPFLKTVQDWEKSLSLIGEVCDIWMLVQRKWMYLEAIFIGGDIRSQLPEEAKKFDKIDSSFRKIMTDTVNNPNIKICCH